MMRRSCLLVAFLVSLMIPSSLCVYHKEPKPASMMRCKKNELEALLKFKHSFKDPMNRLSSWVGEDCCHWLGVRCDNVTGDVIKLMLRENPVNNQDCSCKGSLVSSELNSALLELEFLRYLDLSGNDFSGSQIPEFIGSMRHLRYLNLSRAGFSGSIPPQLGNLTNLVWLDLHINLQCIEFSSFYAKSLGWASGFSKLKWFDIGSCDLSEAHDTFQVLASLSSLTFISLNACPLSTTHLPEASITNTSNPYFQNLRNLDFSSTGLEGPFPSIVKDMVSLETLTLSYNSFTGSIPLWLGNLRHLKILKLQFNNFSWVEGGVWGIMGNPCNFKTLDLSGNIIVQGDILKPPLNSSVCASYDFEYLDLGDNKLNGSLPSLLGELRNLQHLDLSRNGFQGGIPASIVNLSALKYLDLSVNKLSGQIPDFVGHLTSIEQLDISSNSVQGAVSGIGNLSRLSYLDVSLNKLSVDLSFNQIPPFQLEVLRAHSCEINTVFPQWLMNQTRIERLDLSYTGISGELPVWLWNMSNLQMLQLSGNHLTGSLPSHFNCDGLWLLDLHKNRLSGSIPYWLSHLETINVIDLSENMLSGAIFEGGNASSLLTGRNTLEVLDLGDNMLSGDIRVGYVKPDASLKILSLRNNDFSGSIYPHLCHFPSLRILELAQNRLTGHIPACLGSLQFDSSTGGLTSETGVEIDEVVKGITEVFAGIQGTQSIIDLSSNDLIGTIPEELTNISKLVGLNLSNNHLTGGIPREIGNLQLLDSLDLSNNQLSGIIPQSISDIRWLSSLNLSNNNLHGPIPTGSQLQTLPYPSIYAGNPGLCGFPLKTECTKVYSSPNVPPSAGDDGEEEEDKREKLWLYAFVMLGVGTGFWCVVGTLVIKKSWRYAYFRFIEETADKMYAPFKRMNRSRNRPTVI